MNFSKQFLLRRRNIIALNSPGVCNDFCLWMSICANLCKKGEHLQPLCLEKPGGLRVHQLNGAKTTATTSTNTAHFLSSSSRFHPHVRRQLKREERDDREPRVSLRISKWSELHLGDCGRGREQDSHRLSVFRHRGGIRLFIFV